MQEKNYTYKGTDSVVDLSDLDASIGKIENSLEKGFGGVTETQKLLFAKQILLGLGILFFVAMMLSLFPTKASHSLLEICKIVIPPLATLIIVFYFKEKGI
jgi:hypothetical protein